MCVCTQIYTRLHARQMRKVLDGVKRLISHYGDAWKKEAADRRRGRLEESVRGGEDTGGVLVSTCEHSRFSPNYLDG